MSSKTQLAVGLDAGSSPHALRHLRDGKRRYPLPVAWPRALRRLGEGPHDRSGGRRRIDSRRRHRCRAWRAGFGGRRHRRHRRNGSPRRAEPRSLRIRTSARTRRRGSGIRRRTGRRRPPGARSHAAARAAAGFHAGWPRGIPPPAEKRMFAPGGSRPHRDCCGAGASGAGGRRAPGAPRRGRNRV